MTAPTEPIYAALRARMDSVSWISSVDGKSTSFITKSRRIKMFDKVPGTQQPWCGQAEYGEAEEQITNMPYKTTLEAHWLIYQCVGKDPKAEPTKENNLIVEAVRKALLPIPDDVGFPERNTLGNLAFKCFINGRIFKDPGDIDGQGLILIPIRILVP